VDTAAVVAAIVIEVDTEIGQLRQIWVCNGPSDFQEKRGIGGGMT